MKNWTPLSLNLWWVVSVLTLQYSPGLGIKNKATQVRSLMEMFLVLVPWADMFKAFIPLTWSIRTLVGG